MVNILPTTPKKDISFVSESAVRRLFAALRDAGFLQNVHHSYSEEEKFKEFERWCRYEGGGNPKIIRNTIVDVLTDWYFERLCPHCLDDIPIPTETITKTYHGKIITDNNDFQLETTRQLYEHFNANIAELAVYDSNDALLFQTSIISGQLFARPNIALAAELYRSSEALEEAECSYIMNELWDIEILQTIGSIHVTPKPIYIYRILFRASDEAIEHIYYISYEAGRWDIRTTNR